MDPSHYFSLSLELKIIRARNINHNSSDQDLFVRCYLSAESNKRVKLDSQEISPKSNLTFNQTFSLGCLGSKDAIKCLKQGTIVFELRQRRSATFIGRMIKGSKLLATAEMPWNDVVDVPNMEIEKWVVMVQKTGSRVYDDVIKPPAVLIAMKVQESAEVIERKKINEWDEHCGCNSCAESEFLAIGAALEAF
ncbi:hypothetical protein PHJA_000626600 [Phtheirospermum japonicum]|uniref:C2 domain-containing protein n=1 Tax=Phtheirospermum japonicum TaxID=374723 RepID=A0A830BI99_9LAMI|nr:hypothetical protein PHJA_000626600 [Phtheirospermum japonicum]